MSDIDTPQFSEFSNDSNQPADANHDANQTATPEPSGKKGTLKWVVAAVVLLAACITICTILTPSLVKNVAESRMRSAGLDNPSMKITSAGPFFASASDLSFSNGKSVEVSGATGQAGYAPTNILTGGPVDAATVENARIVVDLDKVLAASQDGKLSIFNLPYALPKMLSSVPARSFLVRGAEIRMTVGGETKIMHVDALARQPSDGARLATFSLSGENGDQMLLSVDGKDKSNSISAEGSLDSLGWLIACGPAMDINLPEKVGLESAPLVIQFIMNEEGEQPGKWVGVVSQPWLQYDNGPLMVSLKDARAGFTGKADNLIKGAAEGELLFNVGDVSVGPFHPTVSISDAGRMEAKAQDVTVKGARASMKLDYLKVGTNFPIESRELTLKGVVKPSWFPTDLALTISLPATLDGMFVDVELPRTTLNDIAIPDGWLPATMNGLKVSGGVDADLSISTGGLTAGGYASTCRISADNASISMPVGAGKLDVAGIRVRNARFSALSNGFSFELPEGMKAASLKLGLLALTDVQLWPCRMSLPGDASIGSATATFCGGRFIASAMRGKVTADGVFTPTSPFEVRASGVNLTQFGEMLPRKPVIAGSAELIVKVIPASGENGAQKIELKSAVQSDSISFSDGSFKFTATSLDAVCDVSSSPDAHDLAARLTFIKPLKFSSIDMGGFNATNVEVDGWAETSLGDIVASSIKGSFFMAKTALSFDFSNGTLAREALKLSGIDGRIIAELGGDSPRLASADAFKIALASVGALEVQNLRVSFDITPKSGFNLTEAAGEFCGGKISVADFKAVEGGYNFTAKLENISATSLAALFPKFTGRISGLFNGELSLRWNNGVLTVLSGKLAMNPSSLGRFSYTDANAVLAGVSKLDEANRSRAAHTVGNMAIRECVLIISGENVKLHLVGDSSDGQGIPVDTTISLDAAAAESAQSLVGESVKVQFAK